MQTGRKFRCVEVVLARISLGPTAAKAFELIMALAGLRRIVFSPCLGSQQIANIKSTPHDRQPSARPIGPDSCAADSRSRPEGCSDLLSAINGLAAILLRFPGLPCLANISSISRSSLTPRRLAETKDRLVPILDRCRPDHLDLEDARPHADRIAKLAASET
jgi:hypothetical protein